MSAEYNDTNLGDISVDNEVIKNIALKAATDVNGIHGIRKGPIERIWSSLTKKGSAVGVKLEFSSGSEVKITLRLMIEYGVNIPYIAGEVQESVKNAVEYMTGLSVTEVVVKIIEIQTEKGAILKQGSKGGKDANV